MHLFLSNNEVTPGHFTDPDGPRQQQTVEKKQQ